MKPEIILQSDILDIIFENRNKDYGAYVLRKEYSQRLFHSLGGVLFIMLAGVVFLFWNGRNPQQNIQPPPLPVDSGIRLKKVELQPPYQPKPPTAPRFKTIANPPPVIVPDNTPTDPAPTFDELDKAIISSVTVDSPLTGDIVAPPAEQPAGTGAITAAPEPEKPVILEEAEVVPEFPGGLNGWRRFLQKNLRSPQMDDGQESSIKVVVKFVVNEDGSLTGLEIIRSGGVEFDKEVMRVMKISPKWVAGSDKGRKVKVYRKQPIIFTYEPE